MPSEGFGVRRRSCNINWLPFWSKTLSSNPHGLKVTCPMFDCTIVEEQFRPMAIMKI